MPASSMGVVSADSPEHLSFRRELSGAPLLELFQEADVPADASIAGVKQKLNALAVEMNLDLSFIRNPV